MAISITLEQKKAGPLQFKQSGATHTYEVVRLINSVTYNVGDFLPKSEVKQLCEAPTWKVTIK